MTFANIEQAEFWSGLAPAWIEFEDQLTQVSRLPGQLAMDRLGLHAGQRVVDLGCGTGATTLELAHADGKIMFRKELRDTSAVNNFGGDSLPCAAHLRIPLETAAGVYTIRVILHDRGSGQTVQVQREVKVAPAGFGLVQVGTSADREGNIPWSPIGRVGDAIYFNFSVVGFGRDAKTKEPDVRVTLRILDEKGKQVNTTKLTGAAKENVPESFRLVPMQFGLTLNRPGRFTLELTAVDHVSGKKNSLSFPLHIVVSP